MIEMVFKLLNPLKCSGIMVTFKNCSVPSRHSGTLALRAECQTARMSEKC